MSLLSDEETDKATRAISERIEEICSCELAFVSFHFSPDEDEVNVAAAPKRGKKRHFVAKSSNNFKKFSLKEV